MNKAKFFVSVLVNLLFLESFSFALLQVKIVPENFPFIFPATVGTPTLHLTLQDEPFEKAYLLKGNEEIPLFLQKPVKEARVEYGAPSKHRVAYCKENRNKKMNIVIPVRYENETFSCSLNNE